MAHILIILEEDFDRLMEHFNSFNTFLLNI